MNLTEQFFTSLQQGPFLSLILAGRGDLAQAPENATRIALRPYFIDLVDAVARFIEEMPISTTDILPTFILETIDLSDTEEAIVQDAINTASGQLALKQMNMRFQQH